MTPSDEQLEEIAQVLEDWDPLGNKAKSVTDLDGYRTEAEDIAFGPNIVESETNVAERISDVLYEAFDLDLSIDDCLEAAELIASILKEE